MEVAEDTEDYYKCKLTETEEQLAAITNQLHDVRVHVSNCERKERLATKERDVYRGLLDSYKAEELCAPANGNGVPTASSRASERTSQLEQAGRPMLQHASRPILHHKSCGPLPHPCPIHTSLGVGCELMGRWNSNLASLRL